MPLSVALAGPNAITHGSPLIRQPVAVLTAASKAAFEAVPLKPSEYVPPIATVVHAGKVKVNSLVALSYDADVPNQPAAGKPFDLNLITADVP